MAKRKSAADPGTLHHASLAVLAEQAGNYEDAARQWRVASGASLNPGSSALYEEAAKRCERRLKEKFGQGRE